MMKNLYKSQESEKLYNRERKLSRGGGLIYDNDINFVFILMLESVLVWFLIHYGLAWMRG